MKIHQLLGVALLMACTTALAQQTIKIAQPVWSTLPPKERDSILDKYVVEVVAASDFGIIIDNQGVNESTPATNTGATLGGALGQTTYLDRAIRGGNYSATSQLGAALLGSVIGSSLDRGAVAQHHFRYAVKLASGDIRYVDEVQSSAFRHPVGVCVSVPSIALIDQDLCAQTLASVKTQYLGKTESIAPASLAFPKSTADQAIQPISLEASASLEPALSQVNCKLGTLAPVRTSAVKCKLIGGSPVQ